MIVYSAVTTKNELNYMTMLGFEVLCSYHYFKTTDISLYTDSKKVFIDSGAFSAKHSGSGINIDNYINYIKKYKFELYANLDVINDAGETLNNQKYMESKGLKPIPVFHQRESLEYLQYYIENYDYLALGSPTKEGGDIWVEACWKEIIKKSKNIKIHGFGITDTEMMLRYPWYSIDSSSFKAGKRYGRAPIYNPLKKEIFYINYNKYKDYINNIIYPMEVENKILYILSDYLSAYSYVRLAQDISNKEQNFDHLQNQLSIF